MRPWYYLQRQISVGEIFHPSPHLKLSHRGRWNRIPACKRQHELGRRAWLVGMISEDLSHISEDLSWSHNTQQIARKSQQQLYFLRNLRKFGLSTKLLSNFYRCTFESILTNSITIWFGNCTVQERKAVQRVIKTAQYICGAAFPSLQDIYNTQVTKRTHNISKDTTDRQHTLAPFTLPFACRDPVPILRTLLCVNVSERGEISLWRWSASGGSIRAALLVYHPKPEARSGGVSVWLVW